MRSLSEPWYKIVGNYIINIIYIVTNYHNFIRNLKLLTLLFTCGANLENSVSQLGIVDKGAMTRNGPGIPISIRKQ